MEYFTIIVFSVSWLTNIGISYATLEIWSSVCPRSNFIGMQASDCIIFIWRNRLEWKENIIMKTIVIENKNFNTQASNFTMCLKHDDLKNMGLKVFKNY